MRIFQVCGDPGIPPDGFKGASVHMRCVAGALMRAGHEVITFAARQAADASRYPVEVHPLRSIHSILAVASAAGPPDLIYERYALGSDQGMTAARLLDCPFALEVNAPLWLEAQRHRPDTVTPSSRRLEIELWRNADVVFAVSETLRRYVAQARGRDEGTQVLWNGIDPALFPSPAPLDRTGGDVIVWLGNPRPWHGADALPAVLRSSRARGRDVRLLLVGGGAGVAPVLENARREGVENLVEVTGPLSHARATQRLLDGTLAVAPYPPEPFFYFCPLKIIEYMAAGLPVITSALGDIPDIVGDTGLLIPPGDASALHETVETLLSREDLMRDLGNRARARALSRLSWDRVAGALVSTMATPRRAAV